MAKAVKPLRRVRATRKTAKLSHGPFPMSPEAKQLLALYRHHWKLREAHDNNVDALGWTATERRPTADEQAQFDKTSGPLRAHERHCYEASAAVLFRVRSKTYRPHIRDITAIYLAAQFIGPLGHDLGDIIGHLMGVRKFDPLPLSDHQQKCWAPYARRMKRRA